MQRLLYSQEIFCAQILRDVVTFYKLWEFRALKIFFLSPDSKFRDVKI